MNLWKSKKRREEEQEEQRRWQREQDEEARRAQEQEKRWKGLEAKYGVDRDEIGYQSTSGLLYWNPLHHEEQKPTPGHVGILRLVHRNSGEKSQSEPYRNEEFRFKWINEVKRIEGKENANVFTSGASGAGKSSLVRLLLRKFEGQQKVVFSFKVNDTHLKIGYPVADVSELVPNPFTDIEAFVSAFAIAFPVSTIGVTASQIPSLVQELAYGCTSWKDFSRNAERRIGETKDRVQLSALFFIQAQAKSVRLEDGGTRPDAINQAIRMGMDVVLDFSRLSDPAKTFYAELLLRGIWNEMQGQTTGAKKIILYVDEAHRLTRGTFEKYHSVLVEMAREIRTRGALWTSTQNYTDIEDRIRNQFATQFVFNTSSKSDLEALRTIDPMLSWTVSGLLKHHCVDAKSKIIHKEIEVYTFVPESEKETRPTALCELLAVTLPQEAEALDYDKAVKQALAKEGVVWVSALASQLSKDGRVDKDSAKLKVRDALERLVNADELQRMKYDGTEPGGTVVLYFPKGGDEKVSNLHKYMVRQLVDRLRENSDQVLSIADPGQSLPDVETESAYFEIETGLKTRTSDLEERISRLSSTKPFFVVVPNSDLAASGRYSSLKSPRVTVTTLAEFLKGPAGTPQR